MAGNSDRSLTHLTPKLLAWFDKSARELPWRTPPGVKRDPYRVWLAEIMLQQTTVPHAAPYFEAFSTRWPTVEDLAAAPDEVVMQAWAGLGYYARARNLLKCAREVAAFGGFPETEAGLRTLPGIGAYTAGAVAALAFGQRAAAVDGNAERVFARLLAAREAWPEAKKRIAEEVRRLVPEDRPGDFAEALMDLGATVCTPKQPACGRCPVSVFCAAYAEGEPERYPIKAAKAKVPVRTGVAYVLRKEGSVWTVRRPPMGMLGGMLALPASGWTEDQPPGDPPLKADWREAGEIRHVFTHFSLRLQVLMADAGRQRLPEGAWTEEAELHGLPTVYAKAAAMAGLTVPKRR